MVVMKKTGVGEVIISFKENAVSSIVKIFLASVLIGFTGGCGSKKATSLFTSISSEASGIHFENTVTETEDINLLKNEYTYMGGGVGVGDFNNDGLQDLFLTANQTSSRLYINKGGFKFRDITKPAGLTTTQWCTGVSVIDINNDGWQDIYINVSGPVSQVERKNLLYINNHNLHFTEMASAYGLADTSYSTQAVFWTMIRTGY